MRALAQPGVLKVSATAAAIGCVLCFPRLWLWPARKHPLWYLEAILFLGGTVLWAFIFAWHSKYTGLPVFRTRVPLILLACVTLVGVCTSVLLALLVDPALKSLIPTDYPGDLKQWFAMTLFTLGFTEVFLVFAPFAWLMRLFHNRSIAIGMTILFGLVVFVIKNHSSPDPIPLSLFSSLLAVRLGTVTIALYCYLRGGVFLVSWWVLLLEVRHLINIGK